MKPSRLLLLAGLLLAAGPAAAQEPPAVGTVARVQNEAVATRGAAIRPLAPGAAVHRGEILNTGRDARLEVRLADGTSLTMGEWGAVVVEDLVEDRERPALFVRVVSGVFRLITGEIARLRPQAVRVATPLATIGVRGTDFWGGRLDGEFSVLLLEGRIVVVTPAGAVELSEIGTATRVAAPGALPAPAEAWDVDRQARAFDTVTFR
jgi:hypothetical protein